MHAVCLLLSAQGRNRVANDYKTPARENKANRDTGRAPELNTYVIRLKRCRAGAGLLLFRGHKPSADVPPIEVKGSSKNKNRTTPHPPNTSVSSQSVSLRANWLFAQ